MQEQERPARKTEVFHMRMDVSKIPYIEIERIAQCARTDVSGMVMHGGRVFLEFAAPITLKGLTPRV
ncbi:MAG TPA: hypothetical protein VGQ00_03960 [Candidatus Norongarragalinales archaeon]|jgi:hypothetical protein|nr:hypothetical protein [Candidatus Norongarragalinales archaeon]